MDGEFENGKNVDTTSAHQMEINYDSNIHIYTCIWYVIYMCIYACIDIHICLLYTHAQIYTHIYLLRSRWQDEIKCARLLLEEKMRETAV